MQAYRYNKLWWFFGILGLLIILGGSLRPVDPHPQPFPNMDKIVHFVGYFIATFYFQQLTKNKKTILIFVLLFAYSGLIEVLQDMFPTRMMSFGDLVANGIGCVVGTLFSLKILKEFLIKIDDILANQFRR